MQTLTSVMAIVAGAGAVLLVIARLLAGSWPLAARLGARVTAARRPLTFVVGAAATAGSLYFSEVADYIPCRLCWYQRIAMYPIALVGLVALLRRDAGARWYVVPMAAVGAGLSTYHYLVEWGVIEDSESCTLFGPACAQVWFREFGFVSLALMALCGFVAVVAVNVVSFDSARTPQEAAP